MAVPAYLEPNGNASIPSRLRPEPGGTLSVVLVPRPPITLATLANANQSRVASVSWIDDDGTGHLEPLWLLVELPDGNAVPTPDPDLDVLVDRYSGSFVRARASSAALGDDQVHPFRVVLDTVGGPGGAPFASLAELRAMGSSSPAWWDQGGNLGKVRDQAGRDVFAPAIADAIQAGLVVFGHLDKTTDPAHTGLHLDHAPGSVRQRATLGDLVSVLDPARTLDLHDVGTEVDVTGARPWTPPASSSPTDPWSSGLTPEELARALAVPMPSGPGSTLDRLQLALATAEDAVGTYTGRKTRADWPDPVPAGAKTAVALVATRVYRASDVAFGVLQTELGTSYTGRWITPEVSLALLGKRKRFGVA